MLTQRLRRSRAPSEPAAARKSRSSPPPCSWDMRHARVTEGIGDPGIERFESLSPVEIERLGRRMPHRPLERPSASHFGLREPLPRAPGAARRDGHRLPDPRIGRQRGALRCHGPGRVGSTPPARVQQRRPAALRLRRRHRFGQARSTRPTSPSLAPPGSRDCARGARRGSLAVHP
jgi:hypothetical protein